MDTVLVTGGTGHLGRELVALLKPAHRVRVLARSPRPGPEVQWIKGDLGTGLGIAEAVAGARVVLHAATLSPAARRGYFLPADLWRSPPEVDVGGTGRLLEEAGRAGLAHFVYGSIVGAGRRRGRYLRLKHTAEELVRSGGVPWSIVRATQFHWLLDRMLGKAARLPALVLPAALTAQPADARDFEGAGAIPGRAGRRRDDLSRRPARHGHLVAVAAHPPGRMIRPGGGSLHRESAAARPGESLAVHVNGQDWLASWHPPLLPPDGTPHGAEGVCVTGDGELVLISQDGERWSFPAGRPEGSETWEDTLRREVREEACATVLRARLLGFSRGACVAGPEKGLVLVRSVWRAEVELGPWEPRFEIRHRRVVAAAQVLQHLTITAHPSAPIIRRTLHEAGIT